MKEAETGTPNAHPADQLVANIDPDIVEQSYVIATYQRIAPHFSNTRYGCWPQIKAFLEKLSPGSLVIDIGCGNAKYSRCCLDRGVQWIGLDNCAELLAIATAKLYSEPVLTSLEPPSKDVVCRKQLLECIAGNCMTLPFRTGIADVCICIAVLHHLASEQRRVKALNEALRCLKPGGLLLLYVWAREQVQGTIGARSFSSADVLVPWNCSSAQGNGSQTVYRYCHVFARSELEDLLSQCLSCQVLSIEFDSNNWSARLQKLPPSLG